MGYAKATIPCCLERSMQAPLKTRWWLIFVLVLEFSKLYHIYLKDCQIWVNSTNTTKKRNVFASNLIRMCNVKWIVADIHFSKVWFKKEFKWYKGKDPNIGCRGYLSIHRTIWTNIQLHDLEKMQNSCNGGDAFAAYWCLYNVISPKTRKKKEDI